jgi:hypothetical protein
VRPERVVLFGSWATGDAGPGSDIDLLVVEAAPAARLAVAARRLEHLDDGPGPAAAPAVAVASALDGVRAEQPPEPVEIS